MWHLAWNWIWFWWIYISPHPYIDTDVDEDIDDGLTDDQNEEAVGDDMVESSAPIFLEVTQWL